MCFFFLEMTEEEMMDLALRLSEQEASVTASRQQQEEVAMKKAIQESVSTDFLNYFIRDIYSVVSLLCTPG